MVLPGAGRADEGDGLARPRRGATGGRAPARARTRTRRRAARCVPRIGNGAGAGPVDDVERGVEHLADALGGGGALADRLGQLRQRLDRLVQRADVAEQHQQHAEAELAVEHPLGAEPQHDAPSTARRTRRRAVRTATPAAPPRDRRRGCPRTVRGSAGPVVLERERLDQLDRREVLGRRRGEHAVGLAHARARPGAAGRRERWVASTSGGVASSASSVNAGSSISITTNMPITSSSARQQRRQHLHEHVLGVGDVARDPGDEVADARRRVVAQRQPLQPVEHGDPQGVGDVQTGGAEQAGGEVVDDAPASTRATSAPTATASSVVALSGGTPSAGASTSSTIQRSGHGWARPMPTASSESSVPSTRARRYGQTYGQQRTQCAAHHAATVRRAGERRPGARPRARRRRGGCRPPSSWPGASGRGRAQQPGDLGGRGGLVDDVGEAERGESGGPDDLLASRRAAGDEHRADAGGQALERRVVPGHLHDAVGAGEQRRAARRVAHQADAAVEAPRGQTSARRSTPSRTGRRRARRAARASTRTRRVRGRTPPRRRRSRRRSRRAGRARAGRAPAARRPSRSTSASTGSPYSDFVVAEQPLAVDEDRVVARRHVRASRRRPARPPRRRARRGCRADRARSPPRPSRARSSPDRSSPAMPYGWRSTTTTSGRVGGDDRVEARRALLDRLVERRGLVAVGARRRP